ncbi:MAG: subclass B3 metallo-beta-lactamase [Woeseia sp.]
MHKSNNCCGLNLFAVLCLVSVSAAAQDYPPAWDEAFPGHRVVANLYSVGTFDLSAFLLTSGDGHVLINTGMKGSTALIRDNIEALGFRLDEVKILLTNQAHFDHVSAMAEIKELSGAQLWATAPDAKLLEDGGFSDPLFGGSETFRPVSVDHIISDGDVITLGETKLTVHEHPGHTAGSTSYSLRVHENGRDYNVLIANMGSINPGTKFYEDETYPGIREDYANTFRSQKAMDVDIWVAAHASQYGLHDKFKPGQPYDAETFLDSSGFFDLVDKLEQRYLAALAEEKQTAK